MVQPELDSDEKAIEDIYAGRAFEEYVAARLMAAGLRVYIEPFVIYQSRAEREAYGKVQEDLTVWSITGQQWRVEVKSRGTMGRTLDFGQAPDSFPYDPVHLSPVLPWRKKTVGPDAVVLVAPSLNMLVVNTRRITPVVCSCIRCRRPGRNFVAVRRADLRPFTAFITALGGSAPAEEV